MVNIGLKSILKRKRGPPGGLVGAPNPTHGLCSPGKQAQPTKNHENTAPARAPALIPKIQDWGLGLGRGAGAGVGHELRDFSPCKKAIASSGHLKPTRLAFN